MARIIPKRTLEEIRFRNDIVDVVGSYLQLKKGGSNFKALCPFHKEKTPSFTVNQQRQIYHCFGCGAGGDVFSFIMQYEGMDFVGSAKLLARRAGIELEVEEDDGRRGPRKEVLYRIHEELAQFYRRCLLQTKAAAGAREYLQQRQLSDEVAEEFMIGYAPNRWDSVLQWAQKHDFSTEQLETCGLIVRSTRENARSEFYDRFRGRLMFPIRDEQSRVIAFSGRALESDEKTAKYVNSPETPLFRKSRVLYALEKARHSIVQAREAIVCEGQIDVIRCHAAGIDTAVACQGTAFTDEHSRILKRYADSVVIVFDPDKAGQDAAIRTATVFMDAGLAVKAASLPAGEDPDSTIVSRGADAFRAVLDKAESAVRYQVRVLSEREDITTEVGVMRVARAILQTIMHSPDSVQRAKLVQQAAEMLRLPATALQDELRKLQRRKSRYRQAAEDEPPPDAIEEESAPDAAPPPREEEQLCEHVVHMTDHPEIEELVTRYLPMELLHPVCRALVEAAIEAKQTGKDVHEILRARSDTDDRVHRFAAAVESAPEKTRGDEISRSDAVKDLILYIWRRVFKEKRRELERRMSEGEADNQVRLRSAQLRSDMKQLDRWETGRDIIEIEISEKQ